MVKETHKRTVVRMITYRLTAWLFTSESVSEGHPDKDYLTWGKADLFNV